MDQSGGQYPVMERSTSYSLGALQKAWDAPFASSGQSAPGVVRFNWRPDLVMAIRTREYMVSTITLPVWEQVSNVIIGDPVVFEAKRIKGNIVAIRPSHAGADTNITIVGISGNLYSFYIRSEGWNSDQVTDLTVYIDAMRPANMSSNNGIDDMTIAAMNAPTASGGDAFFNSTGVSGAGLPQGVTPPDYVRQIAFKPENLQFDMKILAPTPDDADIAPMRVYNDGIWTYFDFGSKSDSMRRPVVYQVVDGVDTMVNTRTAGPVGNVLIAEAVGDFTLRNGNRVVCVHRTDRTIPQRSESAQNRIKDASPGVQNQLYVMQPPVSYSPAPVAPITPSMTPRPDNSRYLDGVSGWFGNNVTVTPMPSTTHMEK